MTNKGLSSTTQGRNNGAALMNTTIRGNTSGRLWANTFSGVVPVDFESCLKRTSAIVKLCSGYEQLTGRHGPVSISIDCEVLVESNFLSLQMLGAKYGFDFLDLALRSRSRSDTRAVSQNDFEQRGQGNPGHC